MTKIAISHKGVKRWLETPFAICGNPDDMRRIGEEIVKQAKMLEVGYGWMRIDPSHPDSGPPNTKPLEWVDPSPSDTCLICGSLVQPGFACHDPAGNPLGHTKRSAAPDKAID